MESGGVKHVENVENILMFDTLTAAWQMATPHANVVWSANMNDYRSVEKQLTPQNAGMFCSF